MFGLLQFGKKVVVLNGVVDAGGGQHGVETARGGGGVVFGQDGLNHRALGQRLAGFGWVFAFRFEVVHVKAQHVGVFNGVGDGVGVELFLEEVFCGTELSLFTLVLFGGGVGFKNGRTGKTEQLRFGEELFNGVVVCAKL